MIATTMELLCFPFQLNLIQRQSSCFICRYEMGGREWDNMMPQRRKPPFILSHFFTSSSSYNSSIVTLNTFLKKHQDYLQNYIYFNIQKVHCIYIVAKAPFPWVISSYLNFAIIAVMLLINIPKALRPKLISLILLFHSVK